MLCVTSQLGLLETQLTMLIPSAARTLEHLPCPRRFRPVASTSTFSTLLQLAATCRGPAVLMALSCAALLLYIAAAYCHAKRRVRVLVHTGQDYLGRLSFATLCSAVLSVPPPRRRQPQPSLSQPPLSSPTATILTCLTLAPTRTEITELVFKLMFNILGAASLYIAAMYCHAWSWKQTVQAIVHTNKHFGEYALLFFT